MESGLLVNILLNLTISLVSFVFVYSLYNRYSDCNGNNSPTQVSLILIWGMVGIYFIIDTLIQLSAFFGNTWLHLSMYMLSLIPFTLTSLPIVFLIIYILTGNKYIGVTVSSVFLIFSFLYIYTVLVTRDINLITTQWGWITSTNSNIANTIYLSGLFIIPTSMILGLLTIFLLKHISKYRKYKICLSFYSISIVYDFLLLSSISQTGELMIASKILIFLGVVLGYFANFTPKVVKTKYFPSISVID